MTNLIWLHCPLLAERCYFEKYCLLIGTESKNFTQNSLSLLMEKLDRAAPHFIRCIKPNIEKVSQFDILNFLKESLEARFSITQTMLVLRKPRVPTKDKILI